MNLSPFLLLVPQYALERSLQASRCHPTRLFPRRRFVQSNCLASSRPEYLPLTSLGIRSLDPRWVEEGLTCPAPTADDTRIRPLPAASQSPETPDPARAKVLGEEEGYDKLVVHLVPMAVIEMDNETFGML